MGDKEDLEAALAKVKAAEAEAEKWKGLSRKHEDRAKENADAAEKLKALEGASLTEQQRREAADKEAQKKLDELARRADEADARALRAEVASEKKLTSAQAKRLAGKTREELEADADDLLASFKSADTTDDTSDTDRNNRPATRPKTNVTGGTTPDAETVVETDPAKLAASVPRF